MATSLISMKMSKEEAQEYTSPTVADAPEYPWGLSISLDEDDLAKLGISTMPPVGATLMLQAQVTVTGTSQRDTQGGEQEQCVDMQITDMALSAGSGAAGMADRLYGSAGS